MGAFGWWVGLLACGDAPELPADDSGSLTGIDQEDFERLFQNRFCGVWPQCSPGAPCPLDPGTVWLPYTCSYDEVAAQLCIVEHWSCVSGSGYPVQPEACNLICASSTSYGYGYAVP